jgi:hypothetical protein
VTAAGGPETASCSEHEASSHRVGIVCAVRPLPLSPTRYGPGNSPGSQKWPLPSLTVLAVAVF